MQDRSDTPEFQTPVPSPSDSFGILDIAVALAENFWLITLGTFLATTIVYGVTRYAPKTYTSVAYLALQEDTRSTETGRSPDTPRPFYSPREVEALIRSPALYSAREVEALIRSPAVLGTVLKKYTNPQDAVFSIEERLRKLDQSIRLNVAPGNVRKSSSLFMLEVDDSQPERAQKINTALLDALFDAVKPKPLKAARLQQQLSTAAQQLESVTSLVNRLQKETPNLLAPSSLQGELATPIANLHQRQADLTRLISSINIALTGGIDSDIILVAPSLPAGKSSLDLFPLIAGFSAAAILCLFAIFRHILQWLGSRPEYSRKIHRIGSALLPWRRRA